MGEGQQAGDSMQQPDHRPPTSERRAELEAAYEANIAAGRPPYADVHVRTRGFDKAASWYVWLVAWVWAVSGLLLGAFVAPSLVQRFGLADSPYQDAVVIGAAVVAGLIVQSAGRLVLALSLVASMRVLARPAPRWVTSWHLALLERGLIAVFMVIGLVPVVGVGYALYRYFTLVGPGQGQVTIAFLGSLLVTKVLVPVINAIAGSWGLKRFMKWLRGGTVSTPKP